EEVEHELALPDLRLPGMAREEPLEPRVHRQPPAEVVEDGRDRVIAAEPLIKGPLLRRARAGEDEHAQARGCGDTASERPSDMPNDILTGKKDMPNDILTGKIEIADSSGATVMTWNAETGQASIGGGWFAKTGPHGHPGDLTINDQYGQMRVEISSNAMITAG